MLFILFGGTLETGFRSRCIFRELGFEIINKYNYVSGDSAVSRENYRNPSGKYKDWFDDKVYVDREELAACDFRYGLNGVLVGFNQQQIMDAIHGVKDCLITLAASGIDFIAQIKKAYGDYVTVINLFIDDICYERLVSSQPGITGEERQARLDAGTTMKQIYMKYYNLFDSVVLYTGEDSFYDYKSLAVQYTQVVEKRKRVEEILNSQKYVELPYTGSEPYVFVSYSHSDRDSVYPELAMLQRNGFRIWYDEGIEGGENWRVILRNKIKNSAVVLLFSSADAACSRSVGREITTAQNFEIPIITVRLDGSSMDPDDETVISQYQMLRVDSPDFEEKVVRALPETTRL